MIADAEMVAFGLEVASDALCLAAFIFPWFKLLHFHERPSQLLILYEQFTDPVLQALKPALPLFTRIFRRKIGNTINWNRDRNTFHRVDRRVLRE
jgi:hypothetical protein